MSRWLFTAAVPAEKFWHDHSLHTATDADLEGLYRIAEDMGAKHERHYFERCLSEQQEKKRVVLMAAQDDRSIGYVQLIWVPLYSTFRRLDIPEIQDLNVIPKRAARARAASWWMPAKHLHVKPEKPRWASASA